MGVFLVVDAREEPFGARVSSGARVPTGGC